MATTLGRINVVCFLIVRVLLQIITAALLALPAMAGEEHALLRGLGYGPFRIGQSPGVSYPTEAQVREDLAILKGVAAKIRTYGTEDILGSIPSFCADIGLDCYPCAWISDSLPINDSQVNGLLNIASSNYPTTKGLIVGNEVLLRNDMPQSNLITYIESVKAATSLPVSTAEPFYYFLDEAAAPLVDAVDFLTIHVHPYWFQIHITNAVYMVAEAYSLVTNQWPNKDVVIGEVGWPSNGSANGDAEPTSENAGRLLAEVQYFANVYDVDYFWFSAFNEAWKVEPFGVGQSWGVFDGFRRPKPGLGDLIAFYTSIAAASPGSLTFNTFENAHYRIDQCDDLLSPDWTAITHFTGSSDTNQTTVVHPSSTNGHATYRFRWTPR